MYLDVSFIGSRYIMQHDVLPTSQNKCCRVSSTKFYYVRDTYFGTEGVCAFCESKVNFFNKLLKKADGSRLLVASYTPCPRNQ
uniref:Uncharacterized protein n=1 Tax=Triticum urartu TaxID=4572 RepID=A0A8R7Q316_TRIUA